MDRNEVLPPPPVPATADLRDFPFTPIFRARLFGSSFHSHATDSEWRAGVTLWLKSWDQMPAGSLPNDDVDMCRLAEFGRDHESWKVVRDGALHGWVLHSDGRLYHPVVTEGVLDALERKRVQRERTLRARTAALTKRAAEAKSQEDRDRMLLESERLRQQLTRVIDRCDVAHMTESVTDSVTESKRRDSKGTGTGTGTGTSKPKDSGTQPSVVLNTQVGEQTPEPGLFNSQDPGPPTPRASRSGSRLDENWSLPKPWGEWALSERPKWSDEDVRTVATMFRNYWVAKTGKDATKRDWKATWQNWVLKEPQVRGRNGHSGPSLAQVSPITPAPVVPCSTSGCTRRGMIHQDGKSLCRECADEDHLRTIRQDRSNKAHGARR